MLPNILLTDLDRELERRRGFGQSTRAAWLDILFPADRGKRCSARLGRMDTAPAALPALAAMEASAYS
jgi:hypothetical protein